MPSDKKAPAKKLSHWGVSRPAANSMIALVANGLSAALLIVTPGAADWQT